MIDISSYFLSLGAMAGLVTVITAYLNTHMLKTANSTFKQAAAWVVSILLAFVGSWFGIGIATGLDILWTIITGFAIGLVANGIFDIAIVQSVLTFIKAKKPVAPAVK